MTFVLQWRDANGISAWVSRKVGPGFRLSARRENACEFLGRTEAEVVAKKFKGYDLKIMESTP